MNRRMVDLFSGLGGASESMLNNGWEVLRIEQNAELSLVPNTQIMSVEDFGKEVEKHIKQGYNFEQPTLIWASPPCTNFSDAFSSPKSKAIHAGEEYYHHDAIELVKETKRIIDMINPQYYIIENVRGAIKYLTPILGEPSLIIDSIVLWGRFPIWAMPPNYKHIKADPWSKDPMRANKRALIPYAVSDACRQSIEHTKTLDYWF